jgi:hypothetical protein
MAYRNPNLPLEEFFPPEDEPEQFPGNILEILQRMGECQILPGNTPSSITLQLPGTSPFASLTCTMEGAGIFTIILNARLLPSGDFLSLMAAMRARGQMILDGYGIVPSVAAGPHMQYVLFSPNIDIGDLPAHLEQLQTAISHGPGTA